MQISTLNRSLARQLPSGATLGALGRLCEENYALLMSLVPTVSSLNGRFCANPSNYPPLVMLVSRDGPYTQRLFMTHLFSEDQDAAPVSIPDAHLILYHDAQSLEVEHFGKQMILPVDGLYTNPGLYQKWRANLFLNRWLRFCLSHTYMLTEINKDK